MKIVFVAPFGLGQKTTVWARILPLAQALAKNGHCATILIPPWDTPEQAGTTWNEQEVNLINVQLTGGLPLITLRLLRQIRQLNPDIVHVVKPRAYAGLVQWWLWIRRLWTRFTNQPHRPEIFLDIDDWEQAWNAINDYHPLVAHFLTWQEEWGIRHADAITAASRWLVNQARDYAPETPVLYLPNGVPDISVVRQPNKTSHPQKILFFTRFMEVEPEWFSAFWSALTARLSTVHLLIAGNALEPRREQLYQEAVRRGQEKQPTAQKLNQIEWLGFIPPETLPELYHSVQCAIFPAKPIPLLQAKCSVRLASTLLYGVPVVASAVGQQAEYGADGAAVLVPPDASPTEFAKAVSQLLSQPEQQQTLIQQAKLNLQQRFNWTGLGKKLEYFYDENTLRSS
ncbi:glycosyltransferase [Chloroflexi bacterium TSY]|nr:glycosyltransferase [Chloroflexi bacterium TSY]